MTIRKGRDKPGVGICPGTWDGHTFTGLRLESPDQGKQPAGAITRKPSTTTILTAYGREFLQKSSVLVFCFCQTVRDISHAVRKRFSRDRNREGPGYYGRRELGRHPTLRSSFVRIYFLPLVFTTFPPRACRRPTLFTILPQ